MSNGQVSKINLSRILWRHCLLKKSGKKNSAIPILRTMPTPFWLYVISILHPFVWQRWKGQILLLRQLSKIHFFHFGKMIWIQYYKHKIVFKIWVICTHIFQLVLIWFNNVLILIVLMNYRKNYICKIVNLQSFRDLFTKI